MSAGGGEGTEARRLAIEAVRRIADDGAYANLLVPELLARADLDRRDRNLVTELAYGTTRMRRACDWLVDRFLVSPPPPGLRAALRLGAYQLAFTRIPPHAAVSATVGASAKRHRPVVNAILRRVADGLPPEWPSPQVALSYPDWLVDRLVEDLGEPAALAMLETMNRAPTVTERPDGYVQDEASQWVTDLVGAGPGERVLDLCAGPGGKATGLARTGAGVVAMDLRRHRARLVVDNASRLGLDDIWVVAGDGTRPPLAAASFDRVLVDAPCSGLGVLRRRPDARWRIRPEDVDQLAALQVRLLDAAANLVRPGGVLVYSVCTVTQAETVDVVAEIERRRVSLVPDPVPADPWTPLGNGARILPQDAGTDGMVAFRWTVVGGPAAAPA